MTEDDVTEGRVTEDIAWPTYLDPADVAVIESTPLADRGLPASTYAMLARAAALFPARLATRTLPDAERWEQPVDRTFAELLAEVHRTANLLTRLGVTRTDAVTLISPNCDELVTALLAAQAAGIAAPINPGLSVEHATRLRELSGARVLVVAGPELDAATWARGRELAAAPDVVALLAVRPAGATGAPPPLEPIDGVTVDHLAVLAATEPADRLTAPSPAATDLAGFFHTGGTTGLPKLAAHTHANEVADAWMIAANGELPDTAVMFAALPLFHVNALVVTMLAPLLRGRTVVWAGPLGYRDPAFYGIFWRLVERYRLSTMSGVPTVYAVLANVPVDADVSSLRFAVVGASPLPDAVRAAFETATGIPLCEGYGLTEATCASARSYPGRPRAGTVGQRLPYQQVKAVANGRDLPPGEVGVITIGGPTVFPGYLVGRGAAGPELDGLGALNDGWLDTGDLGFVDADGFVHLTGRAKDLIIRGGHNIDPATIEDALLAHPAVTGAGAVGRPDPHAGEVPVAYVTLRPGATVTEDELRTFAAERVPERAAAPKDVHVLDALPLTDVGKPYKVGLRLDATVRAACDALAAAGLAEVGVTGELVDGQPAVVVDTGDLGGDGRVRVAAALGPYPFAWRRG